MAARLFRWLIFTIMFSLVPLAVDFLAEAARNGALGGIADLGRHGELYLLSSGLCAVGLGEILGANQKFFVFKIIIGGGAILIIAFATALYTISASDVAVALSSQSGTRVPAAAAFSKVVIGYSITMFMFACVVSTSCIVLSEAAG